MNQTKQKWIENLKNIFNKLDKNYEIVFTAVQGENGNRYFYNKNDAEHYIMADIIFKINDTLYSFQMMSDETKEYRFSTDLKHFWEIDLKTKKHTKWQVDKYNNKYNIFIFLAHHVNFQNSKDGVYAVQIDFIKDFLLKKY